MNKKWIVLAASLLLTGCAPAQELTVDTSRADAESVEFNYVKKLTDSDKKLYECILPQELSDSLAQETVSFDEQIRNSKNIGTVPAVDGKDEIGIYQLEIRQTKDRPYRHLELDTGNGGSVCFSGEIGDSESEGYVVIDDSLRAGFDSLVKSLDAVVSSAPVEIRNN